MESLLQLFYVAMAGYGWRNWQRGAQGHELRVASWPPVFHVGVVLVIGVLTLASGYMLATYTGAALPYLDSFTTWAAVVTTWMVARKVLQNWHYWFVIDSVSVYMYLARDLYLTALLFVLYLGLIVVGYFSWRSSMLKHHADFA